MRVAILGPVVLTAAGGFAVHLTPRKAREALAVLAFEHPLPLSVDALIEALWDDPPPAAVKTVQAHLSRVRQSLRVAGATPPGVAGGPTGYRLADDIEVDATVVQDLIRSARRTIDATGWSLALGPVGEAQALFRGPLELPHTIACAPVREAARAWRRMWTWTWLSTEPGSGLSDAAPRRGRPSGRRILRLRLRPRLRCRQPLRHGGGLRHARRGG